MSAIDRQELPDLPVAEAGRMMRDGALSACVLVRATLERITRCDLGLGTFVALDAAAALAAAARADGELARDLDRGPLHGIPFGVKDVIAVEGWPMGCGSFASDAAPARRDAVAVGRLRSAGAIPIGRLATYEHALGGPSFDGPVPPPCNPWDGERITGGSSSGAAAAVAGGLLRIALGTDTGGSVRSPAAYCGVVGLKPGWGRVPMEGVHPLSSTLDHLGVVAATVVEAELAVAVMAGEVAPRRPATEGLRIGYARGWGEGPEAAPGLLERLDDAAAALSRLGMRIAAVDLPDYASFEAVGWVILQAEAWEAHRDALARRGDDYGRAAFRNLVSGAVLTPADVGAARAEAARLTARLSAAMAGVDALLLPTTLGPAPPLEEFRDGPRWTPMRTIPFNLAGWPAISVPCGFLGGLPVGMQLAAPRGSEGLICAVAAAFERATDHAAHLAPLAAGAAG